MVTVSKSLTCIKEWILPAFIKVVDPRSTNAMLARWKPGFRALLFFLCLLPFVVLTEAGLSNSLGPDPAQYVMHVTGEWATQLLIIVLASTPLARFGWPRVARYRRMLGLFVWFYATLHLLIFLQAYIGWSTIALLQELAERPYIFVGFLSWMIFALLGLSSPNSIRYLMGPYWRRLHRLIYLASFCVVLHLLWLSRADLGQALVYTALIVMLLLDRAARGFLRTRPKVLSH